MKKTLLPLILIVTLLSNITISYAQGNQGNQPFWKINGNNNISSENFIGTLNNQDLVIKTDNIRRVIIQKDGLTLFKDKITVNNIGHFKNRLIVDDITRLKSKLTVDGTALFKDKVTFNGIGYFKNKLIVDDITRLKNKLTVDSNAVIKGKIRNNYLSGSGIVLLKADDNGIIKKFPFPGDSTKVLRGDGTYGYNNWQLTGTNLFLLTTGNIGIGVTNPTEKLDISGNVKISGSLTNGNDYVNVSSLWQHLNNINGHREIDDNIVSDTTLWSSYKINTQITNTDIFDTLTGNALISKYIKSDTLAIGVDTAMEMLDVNGNANIRGKLYVYDGVIIGRRVESQKSKSDSIEAKSAEIKRIKSENLETDTLVTAITKTDTLFTEKINTKEISAQKAGFDTINTNKIKTNSIIIDGLTSKIFSTSGLIDFMNTNLETTGSITASIINVGGKLRADTLETKQIKTKKLYADTLATKEVKTEVVKADSIVKVANSIIIDGINDRITSTSGNINFDNINLKGINKITADSISIGNMNVTGQTNFDSLLVKNNLTVGERSGATGQFSMVVGTSAPEYGLAAPEASNLGTFAQGCDTKATGIASFSTGVSTKATGMASFSTGINTIASGESSFAGGHDDAGGNRFVVASGKGAFNYSAIGSGYIRVGAAAKNSAILGGKDHSIDTLAENSGIFCGRNNTIFVSPTQAPPMQTVIIGGENITATESNTVYVPDLIAKGSITAENMNVTGQTVFDSLKVNQLIKVGNTINIGGTEVGSTNKIFDDSNDLLIQSETGSDYNTIINANNEGFVGIGTDNPQTKLHIFSGDNPSCGTQLRIEYLSTLQPNGCPGSSIWDLNAQGGGRLTFQNYSTSNSVMTLTKDGNVGIGTTSPNAKLHVHNGNILITGDNSSLLFGDGETGTWGNWGVEYLPENYGPEQDNNGGLNFWQPSGNVGGPVENYRLFISDDGNVGIGTGTPDAKLTVNGKIKVIGGDVGGGDYVFEEDYKLKTLNEIENYIKSNKHLPDVPSAEEMKKNGLDLGDMVIILLKKIEENTLYIIKQNKEIEKLKKENQILNKK